MSMIVELTNHMVEMSGKYDVKEIIENTYGNRKYFTFKYTRGGYSREYKEPTYTYRIVEE